MLKNLSTTQRRSLFFFVGFLDDVFYLSWLHLALHRQIVFVGLLVFVWSVLKGLYFLLPRENVFDAIISEALGSAIGAAFWLYLMPL